MKVEIDTMLKEWPAPDRAESSWEERADAIVAAARTRKEEAAWGDDGDSQTKSASNSGLFAATQLSPEPGEPTPSGAGGGHPAKVSEPALLRTSGDRTMSQKDQAAPPSTPLSGPMSGPRSKRGSLKEMAERAVTSTRNPLSTPLPSGVASTRSISTPLPPAPASTSTPMPPLSSRASMSTPLPKPPASTSTPLPSRPAEAKSDDSGVVDLAAMRNSVTPEQEAAAASARPAEHGLFEEDDKPAGPPALPASARAPQAAAARPAAAPAKKGSGGAVAGVAIAVLGLAAAFAITQRDRIMGYVSPRPAEEARVEQPADPAEAPADQPAPAATAEAAGDPAAPAPAETAVAGESPKAGGPVAVAPPGAAAAPPRPGAAAPAPAPAPDPKATAAPAAPGGKPGDLASAMASAVGADGKPVSGGAAGEPQPASGGKSSSIPEQPPQGSVSAAMGSVMGAAKACVGGADDVSRAVVTFGSNGAVKSVSVSGWAAANGATGCIKSALQAANVGPFSKPSYTVPVTIRP